MLAVLSTCRKLYSVGTDKACMVWDAEVSVCVCPWQRPVSAAIFVCPSPPLSLLTPSCVCRCACVSLCVSLFACLSVRVSLCVSLFACLCVSLCVSMCVSVYVSVCTLTKCRLVHESGGSRATPTLSTALLQRTTMTTPLSLAVTMAQSRFGRRERHAHTHAHTHTRTRARTQTHAHRRTHAHAHAHTHTHVERCPCPLLRPGVGCEAPRCCAVADERLPGDGRHPHTRGRSPHLWRPRQRRQGQHHVSASALSCIVLLCVLCCASKRFRKQGFSAHAHVCSFFWGGGRIAFG